MRRQRTLIKRWLNRLLSQRLPNSIPLGWRYYAVGDIHGRADLLRQIQKQISKDIAENPTENIVEVYLGDYIDRGPDSAEVIDILSTEPPPDRKRMCLMGNHESLMLSFLANPEVLPKWRAVGGDQTLASFGITLPITTKNPIEIRDQLRAVMANEYLHFLRTLVPIYPAHGYTFVHAGVRPGIALDQQSEQDCMWIRHEFLDYTGSFGAIVVHGHTPQDAVEIRPNRINLDTGAYISGKLTCAVIDAGGLRFLQTSRDGAIPLTAESAIA